MVKNYNKQILEKLDGQQKMLYGIDKKVAVVVQKMESHEEGIKRNEVRLNNHAIRIDVQGEQISGLKSQAKTFASIFGGIMGVVGSFLTKIFWR